MKKHYKFILGIVIGLIISGIVGYAATTISSANVSYNNSNSGLKSSTLQGAIDELYEKTKPCKVTSGTGKNIGDVITCGTESFYVISYSQSSTTMLAKYNLESGVNYAKAEHDFTNIEISNPTGIQNSECIGALSSSDTQSFKGVKYSSTCANCLTSTTIDNYKKYLVSVLKFPSTTSVEKLSIADLTSIGCSFSPSNNTGTCPSELSWVYSTDYRLEDSIIYCGYIIAPSGEIKCDSTPFHGFRPKVIIPNNIIS